MGESCLFELGVKLEGNKKSKIKLVVALDGSRPEKHMQQPTKLTWRDGGRIGDDMGTLRNAGGTVFNHSGGDHVGRGE